MMINNDHHSAQLIMLDLAPYHRIILCMVYVGTGASRPVLCGSSVPGFMNEERGVASWMGITLLPPSGLRCTKAGTAA